MTSDYDDRVSEAAGIIFKAASACCRNEDGKIDVLMMSLAMAEVIGSNASLLPSAVAGEVFQRTGAHLREAYIGGINAGGPIQ